MTKESRIAVDTREMWGLSEFFEGLKKNIGGMIFTIQTGNPYLIAFQSVDLSKFIIETFLGRGAESGGN